MFQHKSENPSPKLLRVTLVVLGFILWMTSQSIVGVIAYGESQAQRRGRSRVARQPAARRQRIDYSQFSHLTHVTNQKLACDSCHKVPTKNWQEVRKGEAAFPDVAEFPEHSTCLSCHRRQFFARERPAPAICSNCHANARPRDTARFLFPSLGDVTDSKLKTRQFVSEFAVGFPHDKHVDVVAQERRAVQPDASTILSVTWRVAQEPTEQPKSCPVCHQLYQPQGESSEEYVTKPPKDLGDNFWLKKGTFQTIPNNHSGCFNCHSAESEVPPAPKDCQLCHKLLPTELKLKVDFDKTHPAVMGITDRSILNWWPKRLSSGTFRHEAGEHPNVNCNSCHNINAMNTLEPNTLKVPVSSCGGAEGCHITATADDGGALNFEIDQKKDDAGFVCSKCHIMFGKEPVPVGHLRALPSPSPK